MPPSCRTSPAALSIAPLALLSALAVGAPLHAQGAAASESGVVTAMGTPAGGGESVGQVTGGQLSASVGQSATGIEASSTNFTVQPSVAWSTTSFVGDVPLVTGVRPGLGDRDGGEIVTVFGYNFQAAGAGPNAVTFDGIGAVAPVTTGNTQVRVTTPFGIDANFNPLVETEVQVTNLNGTHKVQKAFNFTPGLVASNHAQLNRRFRIRGHGNPGDFMVLFFGETFPGVTAATPPFSGEFATVLNFILITPIPQAVPADAFSAFELVMPSNTPLIGFLMEFQAIIVSPTLTSGSWTNVLATPILADD